MAGHSQLKDFTKNLGVKDDFRKFKPKLKAAVLDNDIPEYSMEWIEENGKSSVLFKKSTLHDLDLLADKIKKEEEKKSFIQRVKKNEG